MRWLAWTLVVGCGAPQSAAPKSPPSRCGEVADHLISQMSGAEKAKPEDVDPYRKTLVRHCNDDHWSAELQQCLLATQSLKDNDRCASMFTDEQNASLAKEQKSQAPD